MVIELQPATGRLVAFFGKEIDEEAAIGWMGNGFYQFYIRSYLIPHDAFCGVFSRDGRIKMEALHYGKWRVSESNY